VSQGRVPLSQPKVRKILDTTVSTNAEDTLTVPEKLSGGCMCGAVRYRILAAPIATGLCHCNRCRPQSGSAFSTIIIIRRSTFQLEGKTMVFEDIGASGKRVTTLFPLLLNSPGKRYLMLAEGTRLFKPSWMREVGPRLRKTCR
jgi:Glutathione-dependent formaldehyde-activating enzyme